MKPATAANSPHVFPPHGLLALKRARPERYPFLLESTTPGGAARYSILFAFPGETLALTAQGALTGPAPFVAGTDFLDALDAWWRHEEAEAADEAPFRGGWFVYLGYELAAQIETLPLPPADSALPIAFATRIPAAIVYDHQRSNCRPVAEPGRDDLLAALAEDIAHPPPVPAPTACRATLAEDPAERYLDGVARVREYILAGDVFQVNLARAWRGELPPRTGAADVYARLRNANPAPFSGLAEWDGNAIASSSPERLVRVRGTRIETRPIAGTRPRHADAARDAALIRELMGNAKERAEHVMLIDLERNDIGRVSTPGSVRVDEMMTTESYAHVHHIVSNVSGTLKSGTTPGAVLRAVFPGGTITGCPKVRCMEIIAELEAARRGPYTGAMGYLNRNGDMDLNILIRTLVLEGRRLSLHAGAGIVADSVPMRELEETRAKARGLLAALN